MEINFYNQPKDDNFCNILTRALTSKEYEKAFFYAGFVKDNAIEMLLDSLKEATDNGMSINMVLGLDKKNTSKEMLLKLLNLGINIRYCLNDEDTKLETRLYLFEGRNDNNVSYVPGSKFSEGGITTNLTLIQEIKYSKEDKMMYSRLKASVESGLQDDRFIKLDEENLKTLASRGDIVARITERKIPSINELYNRTEDAVVGTIDYDEGSSTDYSDLVNKDIDILIDDGSDVKYQTSLGEEVEHKLKKDAKEEKVVSKIVIPEKNVDFESASTLIYLLAKKPNSGESSKEIKLSSAITSQLAGLFDYPNGYHMEQDEKGTLREKKNINLTIFENENKQSIKAFDAAIYFQAKTTTIRTEMLSNVKIDEEDILRFIKESIEDYKCEIIKKGSQEYEVWKSFCTNQVKGSTKKFGIL
ncbi:MAG: hypothetical protein IKR04_01315 [Clostridia bacterium]|nr:hypothetical protein [Clostridia bacterium]